MTVRLTRTPTGYTFALTPARTVDVRPSYRQAFRGNYSDSVRDGWVIVEANGYVWGEAYADLGAVRRALAAEIRDLTTGA